MVTTVNIHHQNLKVLNNEAKRRGVRTRDMVVWLFHRFMADIDRTHFEFRTVRYQPERNKENWVCLHVKLFEDEYECFIDIRKLTKCSLSLILSLAIRRYLLESNNPNGYVTELKPLFIHYGIGSELIGGVICWHLFWGIPSDGKEIPLSALQRDG